MNRKGNETVRVMRALIREGASHRKIARLTGVSKVTAGTYIQRFLDDAPKCGHNVPIYLCTKCTAGRHNIGRSLSRGAKTAAEVCTEALKDILSDGKST